MPCLTRLSDLPCPKSNKQTYSNYFTRIKKIFCEDKKYIIFEAREDQNHLLLSRIKYPKTKDNLPKYFILKMFTHINLITENLKKIRVRYQ